MSRIGKRRKTIKRAAGMMLSICMAVTACLGLAACGPSGQEVQESTETAVQEITVQETESRTLETMTAETETESAAETEGETQTGLESAPEETMVMDATGSFEGIVVDAAMNSLVIDTEDGIMYSFSYPESGVEMDLSDGLLLGMSVLVKSEDGIASSVQDGPTQPASDRDALAFAADILFACRYRSMDSLANLAGFPLYVRLDDEDMTVEDAEQFLALPEDQILSDERVDAVLSTNLYEVTELDGGRYVLGSDEGKPNIIFQKDGGRDSGFAIVGIN